MANNSIDFVLFWVDGNDANWLEDKQKYTASKNTDDSIKRSRDWDNLQYWFRGIEKYAPWVRKVHFITCGHLPAWINKECSKLNIIKHEDYIPKEYLPTFSSIPIELNLHRIDDLAENFVLFNDDMFLLNNVSETDYFKNNLPRDCALLNVHCYETKDMYILSPFLSVGIINKYFNMREVLKKDFWKWYNPIYGFNMLRNLYLLPCPRFPGFYIDHLPNAYNKATFVELWEKEYDLLNETSLRKFRCQYDVNQWLMKEWALAKGRFVPRNPKIGKSISLSNIDAACDFIKRQKRKSICINDVDMNEDEFIFSKEKIKNAFDTILPDKSDFEL